jgi:hypothetical protein
VEVSRRSAFALLLVAAGATLLAAEEQKRPEATAVIAGTVFRDPGLALADAKVVLMTEGEKPKKLQETAANFRGEFAFRVPAHEAKYVLKATMKGYRPEQKEAAIHGSQVGDERIEVNLVLMPESK